MNQTLLLLTIHRSPYTKTCFQNNLIIIYKRKIQIYFSMNLFFHCSFYINCLKHLIIFFGKIIVELIRTHQKNSLNKFINYEAEKSNRNNDNNMRNNINNAHMTIHPILFVFMHVLHL